MLFVDSLVVQVVTCRFKTKKHYIDLKMNLTLRAKAVEIKREGVGITGNDV